MYIISYKVYTWMACINVVGIVNKRKYKKNEYRIAYNSPSSSYVLNSRIFYIFFFHIIIIFM